MARAALWAIGLAVVGCGRANFDPIGTRTTDGGAGSDSPHGDGGCTLSAWGPPEALADLNSPQIDRAPTITADRLLVMFSSNRGGNFDIYQSTRASTAGPFGVPVALGSLKTPSDEDDPAISPDGLTIYFVSNRNGIFQLFRAVRPDRTLDFATPVMLTQFAGVDTHGPTVSIGETELFFTSTAPDAIQRSTAVAGAFTAPATPVAELNIDIDQGFPSLSADGLSLYFEAIRGGGATTDLYVATRPAVGQPFNPETHIVELSVAGINDSDPEITKDDLMILFSSERAGGTGLADIYASNRTCM